MIQALRQLQYQVDVMGSMFAELTIRELDFLAALPRFTSLRVAALAYGISAVNATRLLQTIERKLGLHLVERSHSGISLTATAERLASASAIALSSLRGMQEALTGEHVKAYAKSLTIGSRGFLNALLAPAFVNAFTAKAGSIGLRFLDLSTDEMAEAAKAGFLDLAVLLEPAGFGRSWQSHEIGSIAWRLYGHARHPLSHGGATKKQLGHYRFGHFSRWNGKNLSSSEGTEHPTLATMLNGHGAQTAAVALAMASATDQVVCVPDIAATDMVLLGRVREITLVDWEPELSKVYLALRSDRLSRSQLAGLKPLLEGRLRSSTKG